MDTYQLSRSYPLHDRLVGYFEVSGSVSDFGLVFEGTLKSMHLAVEVQLYIQNKNKQTLKLLCSIVTLYLRKCVDQISAILIGYNGPVEQGFQYTDGFTQRWIFAQLPRNVFSKTKKKSGSVAFREEIL